MAAARRTPAACSSRAFAAATKWSPNTHPDRSNWAFPVSCTPDEDGTPPRCVTASLQVEYRRPTPMDGRPVELAARVVEASERKAVVEVRVSVGGETTAEGRVVAVRMRTGTS